VVQFIRIKCLRPRLLIIYSPFSFHPPLNHRCACVRACVCESERERERERKTKVRATETNKEIESVKHLY